MSSSSGDNLYKLYKLYLVKKVWFFLILQVALDESKHFTILNERLHGLGSYFGALPVHNGLWESATTTSHDLLSRLAIVHMVHEARGLDVNPATIAK